VCFGREQQHGEYLMYKLLITDLNGTALINGASAVSDEVRRAATKATAAGLSISFATGLRVDEIEEVAKDLCVQGPCIVNGGSQIYDLRSGKILFDIKISKTQLKIIDTLAGPVPYDAVVDGEPGNFGTLEERLSTLSEVGVLRFVGIPVGEEAPLLDRLRRIPGVTAALVTGRRAGVVHIQVTPEGASKGAAVQRLLSLYGVLPEEVVAVGDAGSDIPMFLEVGLSIAMADAADDVRAAAAVVAPSAQDEGLAWVLTALAEDPTGSSLYL
jgi:hydroxymethylpyrimidine pyrophosphatase-like HAD family hydrolase